MQSAKGDLSTDELQIGKKGKKGQVKVYGDSEHHHSYPYASDMLTIILPRPTRLEQTILEACPLCSGTRWLMQEGNWTALGERQQEGDIQTNIDGRYPPYIAKRQKSKD